MSDITIRGLRKSYGKTETIHGLDLDIRAGEFVVILGPSGCGKSTLLRMIAGLEEITGGDISIAGQIVNEIEPRARGCAMVFQNYALYPHMTVAENIGYSLKVAGLPKAERLERVARVAKALELGDMLDRRPAQLSGGQRQRVAMGRAMIKEPKVFLFDEPLSNLDARLRVQMRAEIRRLHKRLNATSIFVTHDQVEAMTLADKLVVMNQGRIEQVGSPTEIYASPASRFVAGFIGSPPMNLLVGKHDGNGSFLFGEGRRIALPAALASSTERAVTLGIRPEAAHLSAVDAPGSIPATVDFVEELGAGRVVQVDLDGLPFSIALAEGGRLETGTPIGVAVPAEAVHLFSTGTGQRMEPGRSAGRAEPRLMAASA